MALIKCSDCGESISDKATQCVHCGCHIVLSNETQIKILERQIKAFSVSAICFGIAGLLQVFNFINNGRNMTLITAILFGISTVLQIFNSYKKNQQLQNLRQKKK